MGIHTSHFIVNIDSVFIFYPKELFLFLLFIYFFSLMFSNRYFFLLI